MYTYIYVYTYIDLIEKEISLRVSLVQIPTLLSFSLVTRSLIAYVNPRVVMPTISYYLITVPRLSIAVSSAHSLSTGSSCACSCSHTVDDRASASCAPVRSPSAVIIYYRRLFRSVIYIYIYIPRLGTRTNDRW